MATYGQIARLAGIPGNARLVGYALSVVTDPSIPCQRVVNAKGEISRRSEGAPADEIQRLRLEGEGVLFDERGRIPLANYQWRTEPCDK